MALVIKETPSGLINGSNTTFILLNTPDYIETVWMDGTLYLAFSVVGNVLTFADAPNSSVYVDYVPLETTPSYETQETFGDLKQEVWDLLGQTSKSTTFSSSNIGKKLNAKMLEIWRGRVTDKLSKQIYRAGKLWFTEAKTSVKAISPVVVNGTANPGDATVPCDTTYLLSSGYVQMGSDVVHYNSKTSTELQGISGLTQSYSGNICQLFQMPANIDRPKDVNIIVVSGSISRIPVPLDNDDSKSMYYQIIRSGSATLLKLVGIKADTIVEIVYTRKFYNLTNDSDQSPFPDSYGSEIVSAIVAGEMGLVRGIPTASAILTNGYGNLKDFYSYHMNEITVIKQTIRAIPYSRK